MVFTDIAEFTRTITIKQEAAPAAAAQEEEAGGSGGGGAAAAVKKEEGEEENYGLGEAEAMDAEGAAGGPSGQGEGRAGWADGVQLRRASGAVNALAGGGGCGEGGREFLTCWLGKEAMGLVERQLQAPASLASFFNLKPTASPSLPPSSPPRARRRRQHVGGVGASQRRRRDQRSADEAEALQEGKAGGGGGGRPRRRKGTGGERPAGEDDWHR